jgi:uncharacterized membrane protein (UPF0136 family)
MSWWVHSADHTSEGTEIPTLAGYFWKKPDPGLVTGMMWTGETCSLSGQLKSNGSQGVEAAGGSQG